MLVRAIPLLSLTVTVTLADPYAVGLQTWTAVFALTHPWGRPLQW